MLWCAGASQADRWHAERAGACPVSQVFKVTALLIAMSADLWVAQHRVPPLSRCDTLRPVPAGYHRPRLHGQVPVQRSVRLDRSADQPRPPQQERHGRVCLGESPHPCLLYHSDLGKARPSRVTHPRQMACGVGSQGGFGWCQVRGLLLQGAGPGNRMRHSSRDPVHSEHTAPLVHIL